MRMVAPRTGAEEITIAESQEEYKTLVAAIYETPEGHQILLTRWKLSVEEVNRIINGEDIYVSLMTFGTPMQPILVQVGPKGWLVDPATGKIKE